MGKKCKRKTQWRRLSLNELQSKTLDEEGDEEEDKQSCSTSPPPPDSRLHNSFPRRPFHPNFHSGDQRRYSPHFDQRGPTFERGPSIERNPTYPKFFGRPYQYDNRPQFPGQRRRPYKFFGRGGFYDRGPSPYSGDRGPTRRWSEDDSLALEDVDKRVGGGGGDEIDLEEKPSQPVHTVFIGNEYTKIQTPRQEVIFKKSSLDRKRDSVDLGSAPSTCGSLNGCDPSSQCDQTSTSGSIDTAVSSGDDLHDKMNESGPYEDPGNIFVEELGKPPLVGVVMQPAYPGGPLISIPVHWTPYLNPGLIPGDTALTPLDPSFTHVIDPKDLPVDPAHILPVQHDANGCPVTVQVKINADGLPVEIEPSAFTVSLSTLEPRQQEILLRKSSDLLLPESLSQASETVKMQEQIEIVPKEMSENEKFQRGDQEHAEEFSADSQYSTMSEASTAPTTPSGELCDPAETANSSKRMREVIDRKSKQMSRSDSLLDSESYDPEENEELASSSFLPIIPLERKDETRTPEEGPTSDIQSSVSSCPEVVTLPQSSSNSNCQDKVLILQVPHTETSNDVLETNGKKDGGKKNRKKKSRSISIDSTVSSQNSLADMQQRNKDADGDGETLSKHQVKKIARKLKKEKRSSREKNRNKNNSSVRDCQKPIDDTKMEFDQKMEVDSQKNKPIEVDDQQTEDVEVDNQKADVEVGDLKSEDVEVDRLKSEDVEVDCLKSENVEVDHLKSEDVEVRLKAEDVEVDYLKAEDVEVDCLKAEDIEVDHLKSEEAEDRLKAEVVEVDHLQEDVEFDRLKAEDIEGGDQKAEIDGQKTLADFNKMECHEQNTTIDGQNPEVDSSIDSEIYSTETENDIEICKNFKKAGPRFSFNIDDDGNTHGEPQIQDVTPEIDREEKEEVEKPSPVQTEKTTDETRKGNTEDSPKEETSFTCKPGFVMVPILTPYYDPAVLYGYPVIVPEAPPDRNYGRKKKKKFKKRYQEDVFLDTELYAGEPFVATSNGYVVPVEASHPLCQVHGYQYFPNVFPHVLHDEGFVPLNHPQYLPEYLPESLYHKLNIHEEMEKVNRRVPKLYQEEEDVRPAAEEVVHEQGQKQKDDETANKLLKDHNESCDSGVSETEELVHLTLTKGAKDGGEGRGKKKEKLKTKEETPLKEEDKKEVKESIADSKKDGKKKKKKSKKNKKVIVEILEPDFSSFDSPTLRFEVNKDDENQKLKVGKKSKSRKKKISNEDNKCIEENQLASQDAQTKNQSILKVDTIDDCSDIIQPTESEPETKKETKNKELKRKKVKTKSSKLDKIRNKGYEDLQQCHTETIVTKFETDTSSTASECLVENNFIEICEREDVSSELEDAAVAQGDEYKSNVHCVQEMLSQESGIGVESEESLTYNENYESAMKGDQEDLNLDHLVRTSKTQELKKENITNLDNPENLVPVCNSNSDNPAEYLRTSRDNSLEFEETDERNDEFENNSILVQSSSPLAVVQTEMASSVVQSENISSVVRFDPIYSISDKVIDDTSANSEEADPSSLLPDEQQSSFRDLGVTEAVKRWIREVTPEKAFVINNETRHLFFPHSTRLSDDDESDAEEPDGIHTLNDQSKNVLGNPFVVSPSELSPGASSERVASHIAAFKRSRSHTTSQDVFDDSDGESISSSSLERRSLYSSSPFSFPMLPSMEDSAVQNDPRIYDPNVYSKYYQISADIGTTSSTPSTRESTLSPSLVGSEEVDLFFTHESSTPTNDHEISIATELLKSEKIRANMAHISPSFCKNTLTMPLCGSAAPNSDQRQDPIFSEVQSDDLDQCVSSGSSSGLGSSLASTPNLTPAHQSSSDTIKNSNSKPKLEPHPLRNLSVSDGPLPCRTMCCSVM